MSESFADPARCEARSESESLALRWARRGVMIPLYTLALLALLVLAPLWLPLLALADWIAGSTGLRLTLFATAFLALELLGVALALGLWLRRPFVPSLGAAPEARAARFADDNYALQALWVGWLFAIARRIFRLELEVSGAEVLERGPMLLFVRHTSMADTVLAGSQITLPYDIQLRYVLKRELLWDPCLDIVGNRLPNAFADRSSSDTRAEVERVAALVRDLGPREGVLIYPEGTRFTPEKRARAIERYRARGDAAAAARCEGLKHVLPPRRGGTGALLEANPGLDLVVCAHTGLEGASTLASCWRGALLDSKVRIHFWRTPFAELPTTPGEREEFVYESWQRVDEWVEATRAT